MSRPTLGEAVTAALARSGWVCLERPARSSPRGAALAELCEMTERSRAWDGHWDRCPWFIVNPVPVRS